MVRCQQRGSWLITAGILSCLVLGTASITPMAQEETGEAVEEAPPAAGLSPLTGEPGGMTLYDLLYAGGWVMIVLGCLSVLAVALIIYYSIALREKRLMPKDTLTQIHLYMRDRRYEDVARLCRRSKGMFCKIILAAATRAAENPDSVAATMEAVGRREAESMMRRVRYLSEIATLAPLLGLLGTVLGMINAFNFIAFDISAVKPVALASAIAQALITTAAGLILAIPCMGFFFYFRGKLQSRIGQMEELAVEISEQMTSPESAVTPGRRSRRKPPVHEPAD